MTRALGALFVAFASAMGIVVLDAAPALACSCAARDAEAMLASADAAFIGTVARVPEPPTGDVVSSGETVTWEFGVAQVAKGDLGPRIEVDSARSSVSCGLPEMERGDEVALVLRSEGGRWTSGLCSQVEAVDLLVAGEPHAPAQHLGRSPPGEKNAAPPDAGSDSLWAVATGLAVFFALMMSVGLILIVRRRR